MIPDKYFNPGQLLLLTSFFVFSFLTINAQDGKALFQNKCAGCHSVFVKVTGPPLAGFQEKENGKWADIKELKKWVNNPSGYMANDPYTQGLKTEFGGAMMTGFPELQEADVKAIADHINKVVEDSKTTKPTTDTATDGQPSGRGALIFGIISLIMAIIALILMQVNSNLKKLSDDAEGIHRPEPVPFYRNKAYIALFSIVLFIIGGFYVTRGAIDLGRQKKYQPEQPIFYSHKVHAGINQISCLYCHGSAMDSKHAVIPSVNVCMNCHKTITSYSDKSPKLFRDDGTEVNGTAEIQKLHKYAGFDPNNANAWDPSKARPIAWTKIHNLPDHVYFNHSQHVKAGKVQCQSCHGEVTAMDEVYQFSELSMGWCINCHRETKVDFYKIDSSGRATGNKFYSIYEKFHDDIRNGRMDSVTVKDIGGLECQKCHY